MKGTLGGEASIPWGGGEKKEKKKRHNRAGKKEKSTMRNWGSHIGEKRTEKIGKRKEAGANSPSEIKKIDVNEGALIKNQGKKGNRHHPWGKGAGNDIK